MPTIDPLLEDEVVIEVVAQGLEERWPQSRRRGRLGTPAEVVIPMLILKHLFEWSCDDLEQEDFTDGPLEGLKLIGFAIWATRTGARNVTFPARQYAVNGERRSFALLRPISDTAAQERIRDLVLDAYTVYEEELTRTA